MFPSEQRVVPLVGLPSQRLTEKIDDRGYVTGDGAAQNQPIRR
jgi:hypothetical protein